MADELSVEPIGRDASHPSFVVTAAEAGRRLDQILVGRFPASSRSRLQGLIRAGLVLVDGGEARPGAPLREGARVLMVEPVGVAAKSWVDGAAPAPEEIPLDILYEDAALVVVNKPAGLVAHPGAGNREHTLVNALLHHCGERLSAAGGAERPGIVHRLDKETSGCMVVAKDDAAHRALAAQFAGRTVTKIYLAWVKGRLRREHGLIEAPIGRHPVARQRMTVARPGAGRAARTEYWVRAQVAGASLVECRLHTGRTHQIRVHLKHLGHPVLGDAVYGGRGGYPRQMLHAWRLAFAHPRTGERLAFAAPVPADFAAVGGTAWAAEALAEALRLSAGPERNHGGG